MTRGQPEMVDWDLAVRLGSRVAGDGPAIGRAQAAATVAELRADAERSTGLVRDFTGLEAGERDAHAQAPVLVVDRPGWIQANADAFSALLAPVIAKLADQKPPSGVTLAVGSRLTGAEVGALLGFLAGKVLGQFDPFADPHGRLLLVAPNIVHVERELGVDPTDFRLWVCLHEETHRVQFTAVPWMRDHLFGEIRGFADAMEPKNLLQDVVERLGGALRGVRQGGSDGAGTAAPGLLDLLGTPEQKAFVERMTGVMSLLEGHADVVMDGVGPTVIPSVDQIRRSFDRRRQGIGVLDRLLRRLLGLDAKMAQYRDGAAFVRAVVDRAGMERFNAVWERPEHLPSKAEIHDPEAWMTRVL